MMTFYALINGSPPWKKRSTINKSKGGGGGVLDPGKFDIVKDARVKLPTTRYLTAISNFSSSTFLFHFSHPGPTILDVKIPIATLVELNDVKFLWLCPPPPLGETTDTSLSYVVFTSLLIFLGSV